MIEKITVTNFKSHAHTEIELGRVTAIVGPNGCGKTSLLQAIHCLALLETTLPNQVFKGRLSISFLVRKGCKSFRLTASGQTGTELWQRKFSSDEKSQHKRHFQDKPRPFDGAVYFKATSRGLSSPSYTEEIPPKISANGSGLASLVAYLILSDPRRHELIESALCSIVPDVRQVRAKQTKVERQEQRVISVDEKRIPYNETREVMGYELTFNTIGAQGLPAHAMSEGTLLVLGLLALLYSPASPQTVLLDDIEQGLHPLAQRELMQTLKKFAIEHDRQIILTSHSPYIVDELEAQDVWVMSTDKEGISHCKRLSDHPDAERALQVLTTGEFLGAEGEDWVVPENTPVEEAHA